MLMVILVSRLYEITPCLRHIYQNQNPLAIPLIACTLQGIHGISLPSLF